MEIGKDYYRIEDNEIIDKPKLVKYRIIGETRCFWQIKRMCCGYKERRVKKDRENPFFFETVEDAEQDFIQRKLYQISILKSQIEEVEKNIKYVREGNYE